MDNEIFDAAIKDHLCYPVPYHLGLIRWRDSLTIQSAKITQVSHYFFGKRLFQLVVIDQHVNGSVKHLSGHRLALAFSDAIAATFEHAHDMNMVHPCLGLTICRKYHRL